MSELRIDAGMTLDSVNARKEGPSDDKHVAVDLKFRGDVDISELRPIVGVESETELMTTLWNVNDGSLDVRLPNVAEVKPHSSTEFEHLNCTIFGMRVVEGRAHKFAFRPHAGGAELTFTLSIADPDEQILPRAAEHLGEAVGVVIESAQTEMPLTGGATTREAAP